VFESIRLDELLCGILYLVVSICRAYLLFAITRSFLCGVVAATTAHHILNPGYLFLEHIVNFHNYAFIVYYCAVHISKCNIFVAVGPSEVAMTAKLFTLQSLWQVHDPTVTIPDVKVLRPKSASVIR